MEHRRLQRLREQMKASQLGNLIARQSRRDKTITTATATATPKTLKLLDLPLELIMLIAKMLPTQSAACLSLCNRLMSQVLGPKIWRCLNVDRESRASFLAVLSRDLNRYYVCYSCAQLHATSLVDRPGSSFEFVGNCSGFREFTPFRHHENSMVPLRFQHIQLAMRGHSLGPTYGIPVEDFQCTEVQKGYCLTLLCVEAQIASKEFLMRTQLWELFSRDQAASLLPDAPYDPVEGRICDTELVCFHRSSLTNQVGSRLQLLKDEGQCCTSTLQCLSCPKDFVLDAVDLGDRGIALCLTRWMNLGAGLDPSDPKWQRILMGGPWCRDDYEPHLLGSIRSSFESQSPLSQEAFTARNLSNLLSTRTYECYTDIGDGLRWNKRDANVWRLEEYTEVPVTEPRKGRMARIQESLSIQNVRARISYGGRMRPQNE